MAELTAIEPIQMRYEGIELGNQVVFEGGAGHRADGDADGICPGLIAGIDGRQTSGNFDDTEPAWVVGVGAGDGAAGVGSQEGGGDVPIKPSLHLCVLRMWGGEGVGTGFVRGGTAQPSAPTSPPPCPPPLQTTHTRVCSSCPTPTW